LAKAAHTLGIEYIVAPTFVFPPHAAHPRPGETFLAWFIRAGLSMTPGLARHRPFSQLGSPTPTPARSEAGVSQP
jgi:hypothetical protein